MLPEGPGIQLCSVVADITLPAAGEPPRMELRQFTLRVHEEAAEVLLRERRFLPRFDGGEIHLRMDAFATVPIVARLAARPTAGGLLQVDLLGIEAKAGLAIPLPKGLTGTLLEKLAAGKPGVTVINASQLAFDANAVLRERDLPLPELPPLTEVSADGGWLELTFGGDLRPEA